MNEKFINYKVVEYTGRMGAAFYLKDTEKTRRAVQTLLCFLRLQTRAAIHKKAAIFTELCTHKRDLKKLGQDGVTVPLVERRVKQLEANLVMARDELAEVGQNVTEALDFWQRSGAMLADLCNLCNRDYEQVRQTIDDGLSEESFSTLITALKLDCKNLRDARWPEDCVDAPLTHAVNAYFQYLVLHNSEAKRIAHEAMEECFPGIMENALTMVTDADGIRHMIDKDGVEVATLDETERRRIYMTAIRQRRLECGMTQKQIGNAVGRDPTTMRDWEIGRYRPQMKYSQNWPNY